MDWNKNRPFWKRAHSLSTWLTAGVGVFVVLGSVVLVIYFQHLTRVEEETRFEVLAKNNARFLEKARLPQNETMAERIGQVMGARVEFREAAGEIEYGKVIQVGDGIRVAYRLGEDREVRFSRAAGMTGVTPVWRRWDSLLLLSGFWALALVLSWWMARRIARPIARLAEVVPKVGGDIPLGVLPSEGPAEVQSLARRLENTQRALTEERDLRRQSERLAILGKMAASLAHEVRNPVSAIRLHGQLLERELEDEARESAQHVVEEAERIEALVMQWMCYAKPDSYSMGEVDVVALVRKTARALQAQARHAGVVFEIESGEVPWVVRADEIRLGQAFRNLFLNALQAMPEGGVVRIRCEEGMVEIRDHGAGFRPEVLEQYGQPFFSEREGGMGLGVAVSKEILEQHGVSLYADNHAEGGAVVRLTWWTNGKEATWPGS